MSGDVIGSEVTGGDWADAVVGVDRAPVGPDGSVLWLAPLTVDADASAGSGIGSRRVVDATVKIDGDGLDIDLISVRPGARDRPEVVTARAVFTVDGVAWSAEIDRVPADDAGWAAVLGEAWRLVSMSAALGAGCVRGGPRRGLGAGGVPPAEREGGGA